MMEEVGWLYSALKREKSWREIGFEGLLGVSEAGRYGCIF